VTEGALRHAASIEADPGNGEILTEADGQQRKVERNKRGGGYISILDANGSPGGTVYERGAPGARDVVARTRRANGLGSSPRQNLIRQIVESAKGDKVKEAIGMADLSQGGDELLNE